ncbi:phage holin family protein [Parasediminibacterium paludis]|uniref:Phage holin family protein n=1 Tax=Parasediminibacterium paludis TaxID=908966 RepID=A0ABV8PSL8_9BACT
MQEEQETTFFKESRQRLEQYVQDRLLLLKLQMVEKVSQLIALLFTGLTLALLAFFILLFVSIMAGYYFANITGSLYIGFGIVAMFYIILFVMIVSLRKKVIEKYIVDAVIKIFMDKSASDDDDE